MFDELADQSWTVQKNWLMPCEVETLRRYAIKTYQQGQFQRAGIGPSGAQHTEIRNDEILWLKPDDAIETAVIWQSFEDLRLKLNQELFLGCDHFEFHFAVYQPGQFYQAHLDQTREHNSLSGSRVISSVLYLNPDWQNRDAGELVILDRQQPTQVIARVLPTAGSLVLFRSDTILHEVRSPRRERWSLTGWFRKR